MKLKEVDKFEIKSILSGMAVVVACMGILKIFSPDIVNYFFPSLHYKQVLYDMVVNTIFTLGSIAICGAGLYAFIRSLGQDVGYTDAERCDAENELQLANMNVKKAIEIVKKLENKSEEERNLTEIKKAKKEVEKMKILSKKAKNNLKMAEEKFSQAKAYS